MGNSPPPSPKELGRFWKTHPSQTSYWVWRCSQHVELLSQGTGTAPPDPTVAEQDPQSAEGVNPPSEERQRRKSNCFPALKLFCRFFSIQQTLKRGKKNFYLL